MKLLWLQFIRNVQQRLRANFRFLIYIFLPLPAMLWILPGLIASIADTQASDFLRLSVFIASHYLIYWTYQFSLNGLDTSSNKAILSYMGDSEKNINIYLWLLITFISLPFYLIFFIASFAVFFNPEANISVIAYTLFLATITILPVIYVFQKKWALTWVVFSALVFSIYINVNSYVLYMLTAILISVALNTQLSDKQSKLKLPVLLRHFRKSYITLTITLLACTLTISISHYYQIPFINAVEWLLLIIIMNSLITQLRFVAMSNHIYGYYVDYLMIKPASILTVNAIYMGITGLLYLVIHIVISTQPLSIKLITLTCYLVGYIWTLYLTHKNSDNTYVMINTSLILTLFLVHQV